MNDLSSHAATWVLPKGFCPCGRPLGMFNPNQGPVCVGCRLAQHLCLDEESDSECWVLTPVERSQYLEEWLPAFRPTDQQQPGDAAP